MDTIEQHEWDDYKKALKKYNHSESDFETIHQDLSTPEPGGFLNIKGTVTIKSNKTNKQKIYSTGNGSTWTYEFGEDLKSNFFD